MDVEKILEIHLQQKMSILHQVFQWLQLKEVKIVWKRFVKSILKVKLILKQQRFKSEWRNIFTEEINIIALSSNDDKRMHLIDSIETCI